MVHRKKSALGLALLTITAGAALLSAGPASAKGCNGHVNQLEWGCAPWDNNNGPQYPHYKKPEAQPAKQAAPTVPPPSVASQIKPGSGAPVINGTGSGIVGTNGGNIVAQGGGNVANKSGIVAQGGGNLKK